MDVKIILKKIAEINNKSNIDHKHEDLLNEIEGLKNKINALEKHMSNIIYFEEIHANK